MLAPSSANKSNSCSDGSSFVLDLIDKRNHYSFKYDVVTVNKTEETVESLMKKIACISLFETIMITFVLIVIQSLD